jgi:hypothetical protein
MVLLMRYAGLRISDVVTLERNHVKGVYLAKRTVKNHRVIQVELPHAVLEALEVLPPPKVWTPNGLHVDSSPGISSATFQDSSLLLRARSKAPIPGPSRIRRQPDVIYVREGHQGPDVTSAVEPKTAFPPPKCRGFRWCPTFGKAGTLPTFIIVSSAGPDLALGD